MNEVTVLRLLLMMFVSCGCLTAVAICRRHLQSGPRLALDFSLTLYVLTFYLGCAWLYVLQDDAILQYFDGAMSAPQIEWNSLLLLTTMPLLVVPSLAILLQKCLPPIPSRPRNLAVRGPAVWCGTLAAVTIALVTNRAHIAELTDNSLSDLANTSGLVDLYLRRRELFETLNSIQAGLLYGTLPACAAILLFAQGTWRWVSRSIGAIFACATIVFNAGLFQIGPIMAFGLMLLFCFLTHSKRRMRPWQLAIIGVTGMLVFSLYLSLKETDRSNQLQPALQFALRMPIALPYLFQMSDQASDLIERTDSLPHELGEFMFPELAGPSRFVAMPQPAFINAWFSSGATASLLTLAAIALIVIVGGRLLDLVRTEAQATQVTLVSVGLAPVLYYGFQISLTDVLFSSYGLIYVTLPSLIILAANYLMRLLRPD